MTTAATKTTKASKRMQTEPATIAAAEIKPAAIALTTPITRRRIVLTSLCGFALLAAAASFAPRGPTSTSIQAAIPAPRAITVARTPRATDAWANIRPEDATGSITDPQPVKKAHRKIRMKPTAEKEPNGFERWYQQWYGDKANERRAATTR